ncbi:MAG: type I glutamate--ammonia ligase, partial [Clostridia bacterium]|nr:type I glutamate--ammonia ligase [Clostridia bacterium]
PPPPVNRNIYEMTAEERDADCIRCLPNNLYNALEALNQDKLIRDTLSDHSYNRYREAKLIEWNEYKMQVHQWELDQYLNKF